MFLSDEAAQVGSNPTSSPSTTKKTKSNIFSLHLAGSFMYDMHLSTNLLLRLFVTKQSIGLGENPETETVLAHVDVKSSWWR